MNNIKISKITPGTPDYSHKFSPPSPLVTAIPRPRLTKSLQSRDRYCAIVIQGPAGYGKSTLLQQVYDNFTSKGVIARWLTFDESDNDISRFNTLLNKLLLSFNEHIDNTNQNTSLLKIGGQSAIENLLNSLAATTKPVALFLDEFQAVTDSINISLICSLIERCPPNITFYIGTRSIPEFAKGKYLISSRVRLLDTEDLCFTSEEIQEFFTLVGIDAAGTEIEEFRRRTNGWPAILQLLQLALKGGKIDKHKLLTWIKGYEVELADYLTANAMKNQPARYVEFLLKTSLLPRLSAPLCEAVTGMSDSNIILQDLVSQGMFIREVDAKREWYKYHSLFSDYLQSVFADKYPSEVQELHLTAAQWFYRNKMWSEATHQAIAAEQFEYAADILSEWSILLVCNARLQTLVQLCSLLPDNVISERPMLCLSLAWARLFFLEQKSASEPLTWLEEIISKDPSAAEFESSAKILRCCYYFVNNFYDEFSNLLPKLEIETGDMPQYKKFGMGALGNLSAIYHLRKRNFVLAKGESTIGLSLSESGKAAFSGAYAVALTSISLMQSGDLKLALKKLEDGLHGEDLRIQGSFSSAVLSSTYGLALYESGQFADAESHLRDTIDTISKTLPTEWLIAAFISLARASEINDTNGYDSVEFLMQAEKLGIDRQDSRLLAAVRREHIRRALMKGNIKEATVFAERVFSKKAANINVDCYHFTEGCDDDTISMLRLRIYSGDPHDVITDLDEEITEAIQHGWVRRQIKLLILKSIAHKLDQNIPQANDVMSKALELAAPQSYTATFIEEGPACLEIIGNIFNQTASKKETKLHDFMSFFVDDSNATTTNSDNINSPLVEKLTKKELEVLTLVVSGFSNMEIAERIFVSTNTVKFHMKNLYGKLGANSRVKLISAARALGIEI